ncbi:MAG: hypothetical protein ACYCOU_04345 [Sulfobacillus sp.]
MSKATEMTDRAILVQLPVPTAGQGWALAEPYEPPTVASEAPEPYEPPAPSAQETPEPSPSSGTRIAACVWMAVEIVIFVLALRRLALPGEESLAWATALAGGAIWFAMVWMCFCGIADPALALFVRRMALVVHHMSLLLVFVFIVFWAAALHSGLIFLTAFFVCTQGVTNSYFFVRYGRSLR